MSLELHSQCLLRLVEVLQENLPHVRVDNGISLNFPSTFRLALGDQVLPQTGAIRNKLDEYLGELPFFGFIHDSLSREIFETGTYDANIKNVPLASLPNYRDLKGVANRLVNEFESVPWKYSVSLELPAEVGSQIRAALAKFELAGNFRILSPDESYDTTWPLNSDIKNRNLALFAPHDRLSDFLGTKTRHWNTTTAYLQVDANGFISGYRWSPPIEKVLSVFKSFVGISIAARLLKVKPEQSAPLFSFPTKGHLIIHRQVGDTWQIWATYELSSDLAETLGRLDIDRLDSQIKEKEIPDLIRSRLAVISTAFQNLDVAERILLAGEWLLDSYVGKNELLSFVQTAVAMEILLGEEAKSDEIGIGELLRNRCAYLIGTSRSQREEILNDFRKIYDLRSKIVHRGKSKLSYDERTLFSKLRWMCSRVIREELRLISEDKGKPT